MHTSHQVRAFAPPAHQVHASPTRSRLSFRRALIASFAVLGTILTAGLNTVLQASPAHAHDELVGYSLLSAANPDTATPGGFVLNFNNELTKIGAEVIAIDNNGENIASGEPTIDGRNMTQTFITDLSEGSYPISWTVVSSDGHRIAGALTLTIDETAQASLEVSDGLAATTTESVTESNSSANEPNEAGAAEESVAAQTDAPTDTPIGVTIAAIIGGVAVIGAITAIMIRKFRATDGGSSAANPTSGGNS